MDIKIELKENLVIMDDGQFSLWTKRQYEIYVSKALEVGACPAVKLITHFDEKDDLLAALQPSTFPLIDQKDLQDQVREHINSHDLFDWHEALTENEMIYLKNLLLTFNPLCPPGSIGFEKQKRHTQSVPLIDKGEPEPEMVSREEYENAVNEIGQLQEQLQDAENEIRELNRFNNERF